jgi:hypothetical protein
MWNISNIWIELDKNDARCTREITSRIVTAKAALIEKKTLFTSNYADVKNEWSYTSTPLICLHGGERENSAFT